MFHAKYKVSNPGKSGATDANPDNIYLKRREKWKREKKSV
jgi:hypothetical protein